MIRAYLVDHFHHPETGQVLLVKMTGLPELSRSVSRVLAHGDWGECEFRITSCRWPDQAQPHLGYCPDYPDAIGLESLPGVDSLF